MAHFAIVNTYFTAAGEPISERLAPKPINWDEIEFPPSPTGPPPRSFVPSDDGMPEYLAYVPKDADPGIDSLPEKDRVSVGVHRVDERKKEETAKRYSRMAEKPKNSYLDKEPSKKRKLDETDSSDDLPAEPALLPSRKKKAMPKRKTAASKGKENVELL